MRGVIYGLSLLVATAWQSASAPAASIQNSRDEPITLSLYISCANDGHGEYVDVSGTTHVTLNFTVSANGSTLVMHVNPQGLVGVGQTTGNIYRATGVTQVATTVAADGYPYEYTVVNNFRFIGPGSGNNYNLHSLQHATVNANGSMTVFIDSFSTDCK